MVRRGEEIREIAGQLGCSRNMMSLQHQCIAEICEQLKFAALASDWRALAKDAARDAASFADFEKVLASEQRARDERRINNLMKLATIPAIRR